MNMDSPIIILAVLAAIALVLVLKQKGKSKPPLPSKTVPVKPEAEADATSPEMGIYTIVLSDVGKNPQEVVQFLKARLDLSAETLQNLLNKLPQPVIRWVDQDSAMETHDALVARGAKVQLETFHGAP